MFFHELQNHHALQAALADVWEPGNDEQAVDSVELRPWIQKAFNTG